MKEIKIRIVDDVRIHVSGNVTVVTESGASGASGVARRTAKLVVAHPYMDANDVFMGGRYFVHCSRCGRPQSEHLR